MIFTIRATSETISTRREKSGRVARLFDKSVGLCDALYLSAVCRLLRCRHGFQIGSVSTDGYRQIAWEIQVIRWHVFVNELFDGLLTIFQTANVFRGNNASKSTGNIPRVSFLCAGNRTKARNQQSSQYQSHINPLRISPNKARLPHFGNGEGMIMVQHSASLVNLPLFIAPEQAEINRLQAERETLQRRINLTRPHSHKRVELEARLRIITAQQLTISAELGRNQ